MTEQDDATREELWARLNEVAGELNRAGALVRLFCCERCLDNHGSNPQSVSCYCRCHDSTRDEARWPMVRADVLKLMRQP